MTGADIIKIIKDRHLEDFDLEFTFTDGHSEKGFPNIRTFSIDSICDIGYSSNEVSFDGEEKNV